MHDCSYRAHDATRPPTLRDSGPGHGASALDRFAIRSGTDATPSTDTLAGMIGDAPETEARLREIDNELLAHRRHYTGAKSDNVRPGPALANRHCKTCRNTGTAISVPVVQMVIDASKDQS